MQVRAVDVQSLSFWSHKLGVTCQVDWQPHPCCWKLVMMMKIVILIWEVTGTAKMSNYQMSNKSSEWIQELWTRYTLWLTLRCIFSFIWQCNKLTQQTYHWIFWTLANFPSQLHVGDDHFPTQLFRKRSRGNISSWWNSSHSMICIPRSWHDSWNCQLFTRIQQTTKIECEIGSHNTCFFSPCHFWTLIVFLM